MNELSVDLDKYFALGKDVSITTLHDEQISGIVSKVIFDFYNFVAKISNPRSDFGLRQENDYDCYPMCLQSFVLEY